MKTILSFEAMRMKRHILAAGFVVFASAIAQAFGAQPDEVFPSFNSGVVVQGANLTWRNYVEWWNKTQGTPLRSETEVGTNLWDEAIARLKPAYVYTHGVNIVIVRSRQGEDEEGFYVALSIASSPGPNDEQFTRMVIAQQAGGTVCTFRRRGHFARPQTENATNVTSLDRTEREAIIAAASQAVRKYMTSVPAEQRGREIPRPMWGKAIEQLRPLRVLDDRVNVFIVLKEDNATEEGLDVVPVFSSYAAGLSDRFLLLERLSQPDDMAKGLYRCKLKKSEPSVTGDGKPTPQRDGAANGSQPIRSEKNQTPSAAGSRR